ncbi:MAG: PLP-dependent aminotransferase family protein, partial [Anaerotignum sp.]|nr:PLP-dependent aminotransferase family protein [Anaerotignum sp.]
MPKFAQRISDMEKSALVLRKLFNAMNDPETISFGGGAPAHEGLPVETVQALCNELMTRGGRGVEMLQYGAPMGVKDLREAVADKL